ncbi:MAG: PAS domain-containing sensor histidine kinase, partial [Gemmatimonadaceae bacterium]
MDLPEYSERDTNMHTRMDTFDWAKTALGARTDWPQSLQTAVGICLMSRLPMFVWWGRDLINIYNDAYAPVLGKRHPAALGMPAREIWADIWADIGDDVRKVVERGEAVSYHRQRLVLERNGYPEETFFNYSHSPIPDGLGGIGGLFQVCQDETAAVLAERANEQMIKTLEAERRNLAAVVDDAPAFIVILRGADHRIERANERYFDLVGHREIVGKTVAAALPEVVGQGFIELLDQVFSTGETFFGTEIPVMLGVDGEQQQHYLNFIYKLLRDADGQASGIFVHGVDVTHDVKIRATLALSERQRRLALDAAQLGAWHIDVATQQLTGDARFARIFGFPTGTFTYEDAFAVIHEDDRERVRAAVEASMASVDAAPYVAEYRVVHRDGTMHWVLGQGRMNATRASSTEMLSLDGTVTDITERKQRDSERESLLLAERAARSEAEMHGRIKDEFLATLSHEIRTPLNAILGWSQMLQLTKNPDDFGKGLEVIERNARAQAQIVEDLLDMSGIISGKVRLDVQRLNLTNVVTSAVETARPTAEAKSVRLESMIDSLTGIETSGDANRLQQVLWNLIGNAIKFTPKSGKVQVVLERVKSHLEISVLDTGEGIAPEFLPFVFDRFRQADASTTRRHGGLGIGLSI